MPVSVNFNMIVYPKSFNYVMIGQIKCFLLIISDCFGKDEYTSSFFHLFTERQRPPQRL